MPRITCRTPSTGKPINVFNVDVGTTYVLVAEAPDFSIPDASESFPDRDPSDATRAIRPGEVFFLTPLAAKNKTANAAWVEAQFVTEDSTVIELGRITVPPGDTAFIPVQGRSLVKRNPAGTDGDKLLVRAEVADAFDVWATAEEKSTSEHIGVVS